MAKANGNWWLNTLSNIVGTIVGIILTFGVGFWMELDNRKKDNLLSKMLIVRSLDDHINLLELAFSNAWENQLLLEDLLKMNPQEIKTLPVDSIDKLSRATEDTYSYVMYSDYGRNILNSNFEILKSADDYRFINKINQIYTVLDYAESLFREFGPPTLDKEIEPELKRMAVEQRLKKITPEWKIEQILKSPKFMTQIELYCNNNDSLYVDVKELIENQRSIMYKVANLTEEEVDDFILQRKK